jgi:hypothetical protein
VAGRPNISAEPRRLDLEAKLIEEGREDIRSGRCVRGDAADALLDRLAGDQDLPIPEAPETPSSR